MGTDASPSWACLEETVTGASHVRAHPDAPEPDELNQDAVGRRETSYYVIGAVSDGHGSDRYFRSRTGSRLAVECGLDVLEEFLQKIPATWEAADAGGEPPIKAIREAARDRIPREIVDAWRRRVEEDAQAHAWTDEEREAVEEKLGEGALEAYGERPHVAYGATLIAVAVTDRFLLYMQLGDGDIVRVMNEGESNGPSFAADDRLIANETTSLCTKEPWTDFRVDLEEITPDRALPAMILLSTDGCANSFRTEADFHEFGRGVLGALYEEGRDGVRGQLRGWLEAITKEGAGDDVTVSLLHQDPLPERVIPEPPAVDEPAPAEAEVDLVDASEAGGDDAAESSVAGAGKAPVELLPLSPEEFIRRLREERGDGPGVA